MKLPGLICSALLAIFAYAIAYLPFPPFTIHHGNQVVHPMEPMVLGIIIGVIFGNLVFKKSQLKQPAQNLFGVTSSPTLWQKIAPGANFSAKSLLPLGIVLMGVKFDFYNVAKVSGQALIINLICIVVAYFVTLWLCDKLKIDHKMSSLITIGTAICGGSAIVAAAPTIKVTQTQVSIAMAIVSLYGLLAIFILPVLGHIFGLSQYQFGVWAGTSVQAVPQVVAAGFSFGVLAGSTATIVKMVRILLLAPMVMIIGMRHQKLEGNSTEKKTNWLQYFPLFILYFLIVVLLNSFGFFDKIDQITQLPVHHFISNLSAFLMTMAMIGVGLNTDVITLLKSGGKPLLSGGLAMIILMVISLLLIIYL